MSVTEKMREGGGRREKEREKKTTITNQKHMDSVGSVSQGMKRTQIYHSYYFLKPQYARMK